MQISRCPGVTTHPPFGSAGLTEIIRLMKTPPRARQVRAGVGGRELSLAFRSPQACSRERGRSRRSTLMPPLIPCSYVSGCHLNSVPTGTSTRNKGAVSIRHPFHSSFPPSPRSAAPLFH